jgi:mRNA interferase RelE/StbE
LSQYQITFDRRVKKDFKSISPQDAKRIKVAIANLANEPRPPGYIKLKGKKQEYFRIKIGNYRVVYAIEDKVLLVVVIHVGHRKEIYKDL